MVDFKQLNTSKEVVHNNNFSLLLSSQLTQSPNELIFNDNNKTSFKNDYDNDYPIFGQRTLVIVIIYCCLFVIAVIGNVSRFLKFYRSLREESPMALLLTHLTIADLTVTFIMIPFKIVCHGTMQWFGENITCKILLFLRGFGLHLSSNLVICIALDRYLAIQHPLMVKNKRRREKRMLFVAWIAATCCAAPQLVEFQHPKFTKFTQCVFFGYFSTPQYEFAYNMISLIAIYFLPLVIIIGSYTSISWKMWRKSIEEQEVIPMMSVVTCALVPENHANTKVTSALHKSTNAECSTRLQIQNHEHVILRRSNTESMERTLLRLLKTTIVTVVIFFVCWTPYVIMTLWYMIDSGSARRVPAWLQDAFFMMAVFNSCMNPIVYGRNAAQSVVTGSNKSCSKQQHLR